MMGIRGPDREGTQAVRNGGGIRPQEWARVRIASLLRGSQSGIFLPGGPQAWGQGEEEDTRAAATATRTLLSPEQLLLICGGKGDLRVAHR